MLTRNNLSSIYVLDQDEALTFYTEVLGLEVSADMDFGPMRWLTVRVPGDAKEILLERPGPYRVHHARGPVGDPPSAVDRSGVADESTALRREVSRVG